MFGLFDLLNLLASTVYPVAATFRAYDNYTKLASKTSATTINMGGVSIPLGTILKRATSDEASLEEDTLNFRLLTVQMWVVYWIVNACVGLVEKILPLSFIPLYSLMRLCGSLWLIYPIVLSTNRTRKSQVLTYSDIQNEWRGFSSTGCGLVYFVYLKPFLEENLGRLSQASLAPVIDSLRKKPYGAFAQYIFPQSREGGLASFLGFLGTSEPTQGNDLSEYDVVDKAESSQEEGSSTATETPDVKRRWYW